MSVKDTRFYRDCPICGDRLVGTDDAMEVFESLKDQIEEGIDPPNCTLCGEDCSSLEEAKAIVAKGEPKLNECSSEDDEEE